MFHVAKEKVGDRWNKARKLYKLKIFSQKICNGFNKFKFLSKTKQN